MPNDDVEKVSPAHPAVNQMEYQVEVPLSGTNPSFNLHQSCHSVSASISISLASTALQTAQLIPASPESSVFSVAQTAA
jgi:hypothetical protein